MTSYDSTVTNAAGTSTGCTGRITVDGLAAVHVTSWTRAGANLVPADVDGQLVAVYGGAGFTIGPGFSSTVTYAIALTAAAPVGVHDAVAQILDDTGAVIASDAFTITVGATPTTTVSALEPASASIGDADFEGHVRGTGFTEDTVIVWNGAAEPTRFVDATDVWTTVKPSAVTSPTVLDVTVRNPGEGVASPSLPFDWTG